MSDRNGEATPRYAIITGDRYAADRDGYWLNVIRVLGPDYGARWLDELETAVSGLAGFPGPLSWAVDAAASGVFGREVRRLLYYGPTRRRSGVPVRVLFAVLPPDPATPEDESVILLLRLLYGSQTQPWDQATPEE